MSYRRVLVIPDQHGWDRLVPQSVIAQMDLIIAGGQTVKDRHGGPGREAYVTVVIPDEESNLVAHARRELEAIGQFQEDREFAESVIAAVRGFASYPGHSGGSASAAIAMLEQLLRFRNLAPLTDDPEEWFLHEAGTSVSEDTWQNKRNSACFSMDGGKTYYSVDDPTRKIETSLPKETR